MLDIKGPKIRTHNFINDGVQLKKDRILHLFVEKKY